MPQGPTKPLLPPIGAFKNDRKKHPLLRGKQSKPWKCISLSSPEKVAPISQAEWKKFPSLHTSYWCIQNFQKNNTFERFSLSLSIPLFHSSLRLFLLQMAWAIHLSIPTFGKTFLFIFGWFRPCLKINFKKWEKFSKKWSITSGLILLTSQKWQFSVAILYIRSIKRGKLLLLYMRQRDLLFLGSLC